MSDKCPNRHFAQNTGKHQQSIYLLAPFSLFELAYDSTLLPLRTLKTYLTSLTACYNWLRHLKSPALSTSPPHWLQPRSDLEVTSLQFSRDSALGGASRSPLCGETGARRSPSNFTGRRRSGTGLAPPPISLSERNGQEVDCQRHLAGPTRPCVGGGGVQKEPQGNPERGKAEQVEDLGRGRTKVVVAGEERGAGGGRGLGVE